MIEYCPSCRAKNSRIRSEVEVKGWVIVDDYCGICGANVPRPSREPEKVTRMPQPEPIR